jgi:tRNA (guanine37-N1)-methyltransferase
MIGRAKENNLLSINLVNIRDFSKNKHKKVDDTPFGGGAGMLMTPQPLYDAILSVKQEHSHIVYLSPAGSVLNQQKVVKLATSYEHLILVCGHYEGIDERIVELLVEEEISIGDYVLTGGEIPAMVLVDAVSRYVDGVLGSEDATEEESFSNGLLEYPQYTRPQTFMGKSVPEVLLSGHHENIKKWRQKKSLEKTKKVRPDLLKKNK